MNRAGIMAIVASVLVLFMLWHPWHHHNPSGRMAANESAAIYSLKKLYKHKTGQIKDDPGITVISEVISKDAVSVGGYFFQEMLVDEDCKPYKQIEVNGVEISSSSKFAFVAYPGKVGETGIRTFIINDEGKVYGYINESDDGKIVIQWPEINKLNHDTSIKRQWHLVE